MEFFKLNKKQLKSEFYDKVKHTDAEWVTTKTKDRIFFFILVAIYLVLSVFFFPHKPEIYFGVGLPLFYLCYIILINFIDSNRFTEQIVNSTTANVAHKYTSGEDKN